MGKAGKAAEVTHRGGGAPASTSCDAHVRALLSEYAPKASQLSTSRNDSVSGQTRDAGQKTSRARERAALGSETAAPPAPDTRKAPVYLSAYLDAIVNTVTGVWGPLGFFDLEETDLYSFLKILRRFYKHTFANPSSARNHGSSKSSSGGGRGDLDAAEDEALLVRNGLWHALCNAVFYAVTVLDARRLRVRRPGQRLPLSELDVRTGGPEDAYTVVYGSSDEDSAEPPESEGGEESTTKGPVYYMTPFVPVPLRWHWKKQRGCEQVIIKGSCDGDGGHDSSLPVDSEMSLDGGLARLHERLTELPIEDWYLTLRCLAQVGYRRDAFYAQSPSQGSPHELMLALLWLTRKYELAAVVEYVDLDAHYGFLLRYHTEKKGSDGEDDLHGNTATAPSLLDSFGQASAWPPTGFDEAAAIAARLRQVDGILGTDGNHDSAFSVPVPVSTSAENTILPPPPPPHAEKASVTVRRIMALQRLIQLSLNRLQHALEQRADQASALGLHSPFDVQLCQRANHESYVKALEGLSHVTKMRERVCARLESIAECGLLVAQALRCAPPLITDDEVLAGMREDDSTWLAADGGTADRGAGAEGAETLPAVLGRFRAARTKQYLLDRWKTMVRQGHTAASTDMGVGAETTTGGGGNADTSRSSRPPFALNGKDQYQEECRVHNNVIRRYSLQSALAAEVMALRLTCEERCEEAAASAERLDGASGPAVTTLALVPLTLRTTPTTATRHAPVTSEVQLTEVGPPVAGATTSARVELARLAHLLQEVEGGAHAEQHRRQRIARCQEMLKKLAEVYGLRLSVGCPPKRRTSKPSPSESQRPMQESQGRRKGIA